VSELELVSRECIHQCEFVTVVPEGSTLCITMQKVLTTVFTVESVESTMKEKHNLIHWSV